MYPTVFANFFVRLHKCTRLGASTYTLSRYLAWAKIEYYFLLLRATFWP